jgi:hypothetical protein
MTTVDFLFCSITRILHHQIIGSQGKTAKNRPSGSSRVLLAPWLLLASKEFLEARGAQGWSGGPRGKQGGPQGALGTPPWFSPRSPWPSLGVAGLQKLFGSQDLFWVPLARPCCSWHPNKRKFSHNYIIAQLVTRQGEEPISLGGVCPFKQSSISGGLRESQGRALAPGSSWLPKRFEKSGKPETQEPPGDPRKARKS